ncbi:MptD family putative ECF transporter S component [Criibacterium bergeronii]|uniref:Trep_Strep domain-containing protein n=1 Tax=Criibacterium bergeronii TaxID=1871336 RepID=A0A1C0AEN0_9FIRM|nr:MptD family putative ECF transporter S component [Criibacterium bergeronii]RDY22072.1 Trep_Strep domain-containing protein [Criibacterium bergeronii]
MNNKKLKGKDVITIGIFTAIYFAINFGFMLLGGLHPLMWVLMPGFIALVGSIPYMIMVQKVKKTGAVIIMGVIVAIIYYLTGQFSLIIIASLAIASILAELIRYLSKYDSYKGNSLSYAFFSLGMIGSPSQVWILKDEFISKMLENGMPVDYVNTLKSFINTPMLIVLIVTPFVFGLLSCGILKSFLYKNFEARN